MSYEETEALWKKIEAAAMHDSITYSVLQLKHHLGLTQFHAALILSVELLESRRALLKELYRLQATTVLR